MSRPVRVRFAPSPTGFLHVGGLRSALFNWLWARHNQGTFILRLEDTDRARLVDGAAAQIEDSMKSLGITPDEGPTQGGDFGPYVQSQRLELYHKYAQQLTDSGALYRCWCAPERLATLREHAQKAGLAFKYDRHCLDPKNQKSPKDPHVLRFRIPDDPTEIRWDDAVRGPLEFKTADLDDFVALKADGYPTYHLANVIDDHLMEISHVMRADEWLPSTPKHLLLFEAFGWDLPVFAHLPAVLGPTGGKKLSKRDGAQSAEEYVSEGYLPEALMSFLATLGWNDGTTQEVFTPDELIEKFTLGRIQRSPARFDRDRLTWINGLMIRRLETTDLLRQAANFWPEQAEGSDPEYLAQVIDLVKDRLKFLAELSDLTGFFFSDPTPELPQLIKNYSASEATGHLQSLMTRLGQVPEADWLHDELESAVRGLAQQSGLHTGHFFGLIRSSITGRTAAPGLFDTMRVLGRDTTTRRLARAVDFLADSAK